MKRIVQKPGFIFKFPLENGNHGYCQCVPNHETRFFKISTKKELSIHDILNLPVAFCVVVFRSTPRKGGWEKVGVGDYPSEYYELAWKVTVDLQSGTIRKIRDSTPFDCTFEEAKDLEVIAVWAHHNVVDRLLTLLQGKNMGSLEYLVRNQNYQFLTWSDQGLEIKREAGTDEI
ncbi:immunity 26/phosphotriesterase HocA family protein [Leptospira sp. FAT2]|uniref:Imm26 family immunity protein n=1 Tax=Leptospira sanjuanensis TaxID=2879643 RepID=UPI001EE86566|nr:Imm26 family immunity protein [Leptospira sanjuanensis]MCG6193140.1 immunity 26/phosphotriesterase HocA family protein [Leptospira sanjuanensis]